MLKLNRNILLAIGLVLFAFEGSGQQNTDYRYALIEAVKQKNLGNLPGAVELYKMVINENDSVAVAHYELGTLYAATGRTELATTHLERAFNLDRDNIWYFNSYVDVLMMAKDFKNARKLLKEKISFEENPVDHMYKLANLYFMADKSRKAIRQLERIENHYGLSDKVTLLKANIYEKEKKYDKALQEIERILNIFPESIDFRVVAAELALKSKNEELATDYYSSVFELDSTNIYALTNLTDYYREKNELEKSFFFLNRSFESEEIGYDKKMAILSFYLSDKQFVENYGEYLEELLLTMLDQYPERKEIHLFATDYFIEKDNYELALETIRPLLRKSEQRYELWQQAILLANATGKSKTMLDIASVAVELFPDSTEIIYFKGIAEYELNEYEALIETFNSEDIEKMRNPLMRSQARTLEAEAYYHLENFRISDSLFRALLKDEPDNYVVMNNFSYYLSVRGESLNEAEALSAQVIEQYPDNGTYLDTYAWILFKRGEYEEAEKYIQLALKHGGENDPDVNEHAGDIAFKLGNQHIARKFYQKAIILGGNEELLLEKLKKIESGMNE